MNWAMEFDGEVRAWCQVVRAESRALRPGAVRSFVALLRLVVDEEDVFRWLTRVYPEDAIPSETQRDIVLRGPNGEVLTVRGAAPVGLQPPLEMQPSKSGIIGGMTLRVESINDAAHGEDA
jgi:hypothetical protein